jgi:hypothetical protein
MKNKTLHESFRVARVSRMLTPVRLGLLAPRQNNPSVAVVLSWMAAEVWHNGNYENVDSKRTDLGEVVDNSNVHQRLVTNTSRLAI